MDGIGKARVFHTVGELKKALDGLSDDTKFSSSMGDDDEGLALEVWKLTEEDDPTSYECEASEDNPNYLRLIIEDADSVMEDEDV